MNYEQKYKEALERARKLATDLPNGRADRLYHVSDLEAIFPELKDNEGRIAACIGMCLTDANEQRFKEYNTTLKECIAWLEKQGEQKSWSEEDEYQLNTILHGLDLKRELYKKEGNKVEEKRYKTQYDWLKSIKDRVQLQLNQEWSEEDERKLNSTIFLLKEFREAYQENAESCINWLKSLKSRWKPSEEQMEALKYVVDYFGELTEHFAEYEEINSLYNDLKSL